MIGRTLSHFRVDAKLGEGGMGVVYLATDTSLGREVALKVLPESTTRGAAADERRERFFLEARAAAAVTHPNLATVYEVGEYEGHVFIAMELVVGVTLREPIASGLSRSDALGLATQIAGGLARAHEMGIIHRDLKPENIMVTTRGEAKILDFGLAKVVGVQGADGAAKTAAQLTGIGEIMGTPPYMSPEQAVGQPGVDSRTDVFSFGVMLYEMLTGVRPFRGTTLEILYAVVHSEPVPAEALRPDIPPELAAVVTQCLRKHPSHRFPSGRELVAALVGPRSAGVSPPGSAGPRLATVSALGVAFQSTHAPASQPLYPLVPGVASARPGGQEPRIGVWLAVGVGAFFALVAVVLAVVAVGSWLGARTVESTAGSAPNAPAPTNTPAAPNAPASPNAHSAPSAPVSVSPRDAFLAAAETLREGAYKEPKTVAQCQFAYDTYKRLLPQVKPTTFDGDPVKFVPGTVRTFAPECFGLAGDCAKAWAVYQEAWRLDPELPASSRRLDHQAMRGGFEAVTRSCKGK